MSLSDCNRYQRLVIDLLAVQAVTVLLIAAVWLVHGVSSSVAALYGGCIALLVNSLYAWRLFRKMDERSAQQIILTLYAGEVLKIIACGLCTVLVIKFFAVAAIPLLTGLVGTYIIYTPVAIYKQLKVVKL